MLHNSDYIIELAKNEVEQNPHIRLGQAVFNEAYKSYPEAADKLRGSTDDCFHRDDKIEGFLSMINTLTEKE